MLLCMAKRKEQKKKAAIARSDPKRASKVESSIEVYYPGRVLEAILPLVRYPVHYRGVKWFSPRSCRPSGKSDTRCTTKKRRATCRLATLCYFFFPGVHGLKSKRRDYSQSLRLSRVCIERSINPETGANQTPYSRRESTTIIQGRKWSKSKAE